MKFHYFNENNYIKQAGNFTTNQMFYIDFTLPDLV